MQFIENLKWYFRGPFWAEQQVAKHMRNMGYTVFTNIFMYDSKKRDHTEADVLAISGDSVVLIEVKTWAGQWYAGDTHKFPKWYKANRRVKARSPMSQVNRCRRILYRALIESFFKPNEAPKNDRFIKAFVCFERGEILNENENIDIWNKKRITVTNLKGLKNMIPYNHKKVDAYIEGRFIDYNNFMKWKWFCGFLKKVGLKDLFMPWYLARQHKKYVKYLLEKHQYTINK